MDETRMSEMTLALNGLEVDCIIGELPGERVREQRLVVDAVLKVDGAVAATDSLADAADYAALGGKIRSRLAEARCRMSERAAFIAAEVCMEDPRVLAAEVKVTKTGAVEGLRSASATARLVRERREAGD